MIRKPVIIAKYWFWTLVNRNVLLSEKSCFDIIFQCLKAPTLYSGEYMWMRDCLSTWSFMLIRYIPMRAKQYISILSINLMISKISSRLFDETSEFFHIEMLLFSMMSKNCLFSFASFVKWRKKKIGIMIKLRASTQLK